MKLSIFLVLAAFLFSPETAFSASKSMCPEKVLGNGTVEGIYQGNECGDLCYSTIKLDNGEDFTFLCDEDDAEKSFGKGTGQKVSMSYEVLQFWNEDGQQCSRVETFKSGKILAAAKEQARTPEPVSATPPAQSRKRYFTVPEAIQAIKDANQRLRQRGKPQYTIFDSNNNIHYDDFGGGVLSLFSPESDVKDPDYLTVRVAVCTLIMDDPRFQKDNGHYEKAIKNLRAKICPDDVTSDVVGPLIEKAKQTAEADRTAELDRLASAKAFLEQNKNGAINVIKRAYFGDYPEKEKFPAVGKALEKFFDNPLWEANILSSPNTDSGRLFEGKWEVIFKGTAKYNGQNARFIFRFLSVTPEQVKTGGYSFITSITINGKNADVGDMLATIFLN